MPKDELIEALEKATGPDRGIDFALHEMRTGKKYRWAEFGGIFGVIDPQAAQIAVEVLPLDGTEREHLFHWADRDVGIVPAYTASIDAALTLLSELANWRVSRYGEVWLEDDEGFEWRVKAETPALAICIAALRAKGDE